MTRETTLHGGTHHALEGTATDHAAEGARRAAVLSSFALDGLEDDPELQAITRFASSLCKVPVALVSIVEDSRQWFLAREGLQERETPRDVSFCAHAMAGEGAMVVPDATRDPRFADNALVTGPHHIRFYAGQPLVSREGTPLGALCVIDVQERPASLDEFQREGLAVLAQAVMRLLEARREDLRARRAIADREDQLLRMIDGVPQIAWSLTTLGQFDYVNSRWKEVTGAEPPKCAEDWRAFIHPDDANATLDNWRKSLAEDEPFESEFRLRKADGSWSWMLAQASPVARVEGEQHRWFGTLTDIDEVHRAIEARDLLAGELSHRIKNIFAVVIGLARLKAANAPEHKPFAEDLAEALFALSRAHEFVRPAGEAGQERLHGLLSALFAPYRDRMGQPRVTISGTDSTVVARAATPLALVFHELATNSAKYGALSCADGTVELTITDKGDDLLLEWRERGGPRLTDAPSKSGFGSRLIEMSVTGQLRGSWERRFEPEGLVAELTVSKAAIAP
ncbi:PAS domain S-box protein [Aurantiacibacter xanthus]|uniref:histidine kinase n=1 Tax=Aurantiacibacter xanthus TaxID=1784712 RepID=A0A3A1P835_9SPHN|nr:PAS domain-containing protein [Aurantiacibacter xanthus]RIV89779.1 PAS domain S-box protein [Aurantiacibacter xanthus]